ncbi:MAG: hypothetical protein UY96_C0003G0066 [Parcubacteria group bacterium GW2011_GWB1_56_8]|nr:MAG: hypothetical protein UY96_C0003G0066 [Parcubacteria group bacterium GW2011_GWB1_56_8]
MKDLKSKIPRSRYDCVICQRALGRPFMCTNCGRSYDRARDKDVTIRGVIVWVATTVRRFERMRHSRRYFCALQKDIKRLEDDMKERGK